MKFYMHQRIFGENLIKIGLILSAQCRLSKERYQACPVTLNQAINRLNKIAIGRKQTRPFAINKVSTDAIIIVLHCESAANHNACLYGERF